MYTCVCVSYYVKVKIIQFKNWQDYLPGFVHACCACEACRNLAAPTGITKHLKSMHTLLLNLRC